MKKALAMVVVLALAAPAMAGFTVTNVGPIDSNGAAGDATSIGGWNVYVLTELTPVEESSWGNVKALYR